MSDMHKQTMLKRVFSNILFCTNKDSTLITSYKSVVWSNHCSYSLYNTCIKTYTHLLFGILITIVNLTIENYG